MNIHDRLAELGLQLPQAPKPGGAYVPVNVRGNIAYVAIQFPRIPEDKNYQGRLGEHFITEDGYDAMRTCALNVLAQINTHVGFEKIEGLNHLDAYYVAVKN